MEAETQELLSRAMHLPEEQRAELAARLIESIDGPAEENVEEAWGREIKRRLDALESGLTRPVPWEEARRRIFGPANGS